MLVTASHPQLSTALVSQIQSGWLGINQNETVSVTLMLVAPINLDDLLGTAITLSASGWYYHGIITDWALTSQCPELLQLRLETYLAELARHIHHRVFSEQTLASILKQVFSNYSNIICHCHFKTQNHIIPFCAQYDVNDAEFFQGLVKRYGLFYLWQHTQQGCQLFISDDDEYLQQQLPATQLSYGQQHGMVWAQPGLYDVVYHCNAQEEALTGTTDQLTLLPGQRARLKQQTYQLKSWQVNLQQDTQGGFVAKNKVQFIKVMATPSQQTSHSCLPSISRASIQGSTDQPSLDQQGYYRVKLNFDESANEFAVNSPPLPMLQYFGGHSGQGWHHPMDASGDGLLVWVPEVEMPYIIGAWPRSGQASVVTQANATQHAMISRTKQQWLLDDAAPPLMSLQSKSGHGLVLNAHDKQGGLSLHCHQGDIDIHVANDYCLLSQRSIYCKIGTTYVMNVQGQLWLQAAQGMSLQSGKSIDINAQQDINIDVATTARLQGHDAIHLLIKGHMYYCSQADLWWKSTHAGITIDAKQGIFTQCQKIRCDNQGARLEADSDALRLQAKQIIFNANHIKINVAQGFML